MNVSRLKDFSHRWETCPLQILCVFNCIILTNSKLVPLGFNMEKYIIWILYVINEVDGWIIVLLTIMVHIYNLQKKIYICDAFLTNLTQQGKTSHMKVLSCGLVYCYSTLGVQYSSSKSGFLDTHHKDDTHVSIPLNCYKIQKLQAVFVHLQKPKGIPGQTTYSMYCYMFIKTKLWNHNLELNKHILTI